MSGTSSKSTGLADALHAALHRRGLTKVNDMLFPQGREQPKLTIEIVRDPKVSRHELFDLAEASGVTIESYLRNTPTETVRQVLARKLREADNSTAPVLDSGPTPKTESPADAKFTPQTKVVSERSWREAVKLFNGIPNGSVFCRNDLLVFVSQGNVLRSLLSIAFQLNAVEVVAKKKHANGVGRPLYLLGKSKGLPHSIEQPTSLIEWAQISRSNLPHFVDYDPFTSDWFMDDALEEDEGVNVDAAQLPMEPEYEDKADARYSLLKKQIDAANASLDQLRRTAEQTVNGIYCLTQHLENLQQALDGVDPGRIN